MGAPARGTHATAMVNGNAVHALGLRGLVARLCPDRSLFDMLTPRRPTDTAAVAGAAEMLRGFNAPGGIARTSAGSIAERTKAAATTLTPGEAVTRFTECAEILRATTMSNEVVIWCPVAGSTTLAAIAEVALMEATVHLLDLADAVGGVQAPKTALGATRDLLVVVPDPWAAIEILAGRA